MSNRKLTILVIACCALAQQAFAGDGIRFAARAGYSVGATSPLGMPEGVTSIDAYRLTPSFSVGTDAAYQLGERWSIATGLRFERKAMDADVTAQNYHMELRKGSESIEGVFTGHVSQQVVLSMLTLPVYATYDIGHNVRLKAGPYFSLMLSKDFSGIASDGYMRRGGPTGPKISIGSTPDTWATYEFGDEMRSFQMGITVGADWQALQHLGFSADLGIGMTGIFPDSFTTVGQTLYPIYGTIGVFYKL